MSPTTEQIRDGRRAELEEECAVCSAPVQYSLWVGLHCTRDWGHEGTRKPKRTQKPFGMPGMKEDER